DAHATQSQPPARAKNCPRINKTVLINDPGKQQDRRPEQPEQRARCKQRPPVMHAPNKTAMPGCARLLRHSFLGCSARFYQVVRQRNSGMICHRLVVACVVVLLFSVLSGSAFAQRAALQPAAIPSPKSVLGFTPGEDRTIAGWSQITDYFERLDR